MKKLTTRTFLIINSFLLIFLSVSCQSTDIYFDVHKQSIISCNDRGLRHIIIACESTNTKDNDCFIDLYSKYAPVSIRIDSIAEIYKYTQKRIFYPNSCYTIALIGTGDEGSTELRIWLDGSGKVYATNKPNCN